MDDKRGIWDSTTRTVNDVERTFYFPDGEEARLPPEDVDGEAPAAVSDLAVDVGSNTAALSWTFVSGTTATIYRRDVTAAGSFAEIATGVASQPYNDTGLTPENEYAWKITLTNIHGTSTDSNTVSDTTLEASGNTRIFFEDFEGTLQTGSTLSNGAQVATTGTSFSGTKCLRVNQKDGVSDPLGPTGDNRQTYEYQGSLLSTIPAIVTLQWRFRIDDAWWKGSGFSNSSSDSIRLDSKAGYVGPIGNTSSQGFYPVLNGGPNGEVKLGANFGTSWVNEPWVNQAGRVMWYLRTGQPFGSNGEWNKWTCVIDNTHPDYRQMRMYVNEVLAVSFPDNNYAPDGIIRLPKTWSPQTFSVCYTNDTQVNTSENRTGTACGWQFDEIEIWDGVPAWLE